MATMVSRCGSLGLNLGATTAKPIKTPSWTALVARAWAGRQRAQAMPRRRGHTKDAVGNVADVEYGDEEPGDPKEAWVGEGRGQRGGRRGRRGAYQKKPTEALKVACDVTFCVSE